MSNGEIDNPDQRIAEDVRAFTTTTLSFMLLFLNGTFTALAFSGVMWNISPKLFFVGVVYAGVGSFLTIAFGHRLVGLNYAQLDQEATFRADLVHARANSESLALSRQETGLLDRLQRHLDALTANFRRIIAVNRNLAFFTTGYNYLVQIIPALIVGPLYMRGDVEFGVVTQSAMAFSQLLGAFSLIVTQFQSISSFTAVIARLATLGEAIEQADAVTALSMERCKHGEPTVECPICLARRVQLATLPTITIREEDGRIEYEQLTLNSPHGEGVLIRELSVSIPQQTRVLILGPNQASKMALLRVTAGIWENGSGRVVRPGAYRILFLPERPYLAPGTLRQALTVPPAARADRGREPAPDRARLRPRCHAGARWRARCRTGLGDRIVARGAAAARGRPRRVGGAAVRLSRSAPYHADCRSGDPGAEHAHAARDHVRQHRRSRWGARSLRRCARAGCRWEVGLAIHARRAGASLKGRISAAGLAWKS